MSDSGASVAECPDTNSKENPVKESYWWHVNKGGFPIPLDTWEKMWKHVMEVHPDGDELVQLVRANAKKKLPVPSPPVLSQKSPIPESILAVQSYMNKLQYNHTGTQFFDIHKSGPLSRLMESAKEIVRESLPIKCLEAVVLSLYLTSPLTALQRFAIGFKSKFGGLYYRHIVLGVYWNSVYGALGMSRRSTLMYKPFSYSSLGDMIVDYIEAYREVGHSVVKVKMSPPITHDVTNHAPVQWKYFSLNMKNVTNSELKKTFDKHSKTMRIM